MRAPLYIYHSLAAGSTGPISAFDHFLIQTKHDDYERWENVSHVSGVVAQPRPRFTVDRDLIEQLRHEVGARQAEESSSAPSDAKRAARGPRDSGKGVRVQVSTRWRMF